MEQENKPTPRGASEELIRQHGKGNIAFAVSLLSVFLILFAVSIGAYNLSNKASSAHSEPAPPAVVEPSLARPAPPSNPQIEKFEIEVITIRPAGFEPREITRPRGFFGIAVENRTGLPEVLLRLDREGGGRVQEAQVTRQKLNWKQGLDLPPGQYVLTEANNPDWVCRITITDK